MQMGALHTKGLQYLVTKERAKGVDESKTHAHSVVSESGVRRAQTIDDRQDGRRSLTAG